MLQAGKRKRLNRVPWNREDVYDIWFLVHNTAGFITQLQKLRSMSMCEPFEVKLDGMRAEQKREMDYLQKTFWLKSVYDIFVWKLCYGIVPYFEKTIQGTAHRIPVVPEITQGTLFVYEDRDRTKVFEWDWSDPVINGEKPMEHPPIKFLYTGYEPMLNGCIRTPIMCCLEDYRMLVYGQRDMVYASYHLSHPMIMYEDKPPVGGGAREDEKAQYSQLSLVGGDNPIYDFDTPAGIHWREVRTRELEAQLAMAGLLVQDQQGRARGEAPWVRQDDALTRAREAFVHNRVVLPADRHFAGQLKADTVIDIEKIDVQLTYKAAELIGIPMELTQSASKVHAANQEGLRMATGETVKAHIAWLNEAITRIYRDIYGETIRQGWNRYTAGGDLRLYPQKHFRSPDGEMRYDMGLERDVDITVTLKCDPRVNEQGIMSLYQGGFMTKQKAVEQLQSITGLPDGVLEAVPDGKLDFTQMGGKTKEELQGKSKPKAKKPKSDKK